MSRSVLGVVRRLAAVTGHPLALGLMAVCRREPRLRCDGPRRPGRIRPSGRVWPLWPVLGRYSRGHRLAAGLVSGGIKEVPAAVVADIPFAGPGTLCDGRDAGR
jgi:hypothetical protein